MRTLAILPVKSFGAAKQRLAPALGAGSRQALAQAMFLDVLATLRRVRGLEGVAVVTADEPAEGLPVAQTDTLMDSPEARRRVAAFTLEFAASLRR